ncbi:MAG: hypothetical protein Q8916_10625 [Bacteroidota bacterium]|nr:hypothetical protein [Bacteroidota bacterium]MDP4230843.1 hypothetical protein [Bacteroidota bacterium]MDP4235655.1 hypothetical protein [Bacteroidota bacterium]
MNFHRIRAIRRAAYSAVLLLFCLIQSSDIHAQSISGVINLYSEVLEIDTCMNQILIADATGYNVGDRVLLIQMKGAQIDLSNSPSFGTVTNYGYSGNYEFGEIAAIQGLWITLKYKIVRLYDAQNGSVQLVRVPQYGSAVVASKVTAIPWNGFRGGIVVLEASNSVALNADIDVSGMGFIGGDSSENSAAPNDSEYFCTRISRNGGRKGEGIAAYDIPYEAGRGPLANGGGGGDNQNGGGGGGANGGRGGGGGDQTSLIKRLPNGGLGGRTINYASQTNRVYFGGGGGGGHENDGLGTKGGNGGGIIIIRSPNLNSSGGRLVADGLSAHDAGDDGAGGGGAGGTIVLDVTNIANNITLSANGGNGGNTVADTLVPYCVAPGGGGSGGMVVVKGPSVPPTLVNPGAAGIIKSIVDTLSCKGTTYGANGGSVGGGSWNNVITDENTLFTFPKLSSHLATICEGDTTQFDLQGSHGIKWSPAAGLDNDAIGNPKASPSTTTHYSVSYLDNRNCAFLDTMLVIVNPRPKPSITGSLVVCSGQTFAYTITPIPGATYQWVVNGGNIQTGQGTENVTIQWGGTTSGEVEVDVTAGGTSCVGKDSVAVTITPAQSGTITGAGPLCAGDTLTLTASPGFDKYEWSNGDSLQSIRVGTAGDYWVKTTTAGGCITYSDTVTVVVHPIPIITINASSPVMADTGGVDTLTLSGSFASTLWSTGSTSDTLIISDSGTYSVTITDTNGCKGTAEITIIRDISPPEITLSLDTLEGAPCDDILIPIRIDTSKNMPPSGATDFVTEITFDASLLAPVDKSIPSVINGRWRTLTIHGTRPDNQIDGILSGIEFTVALGDSVSTIIKIETFVFTNGKKVKITTYNGLFKLTKLCQEGGTRLFAQSDSLLLGQNIPNPAQTITTIKYSLLEEGSSKLWITDILGRHVATLLDEIVKPGQYVARVDLTGYPAGNYFYILQTPTAVKRRMMRIER